MDSRTTTVFFAGLLLAACGQTADGDDDGAITPNRDAGATTAPRDAGTTTTQDAGTVDSGTADRDAGGAARDAGSTARDAGASSPRDGGASSPRDAGPRPVTCNPSFGAADACGGDPTGVWTYQVACTDQNVFASLTQICPGTAVSNQLVATGGTVNLRSDGTFTRNVTTDVTADSTWPASCVAIAGGCAGLQTAIVGMTSFTAACTQAGAGCNCTLASTVATNDNGGWVQNGGTIVAGGLEYDFCEQQSVFEYRGTANNQADNVFTFVLTP